MKIAIIGSGISGLTCAYLLHQEHEISIFEANDYIGGHTHTIDVDLPTGNFKLDTGFIVFNNKTYPNFSKLLNQLNVAIQATDMSFSVSCDATGLEYNGSSLNQVFAQRRNLVSPKFYRLLFDIWQFNKAAKKLLLAPNHQISVSDYLKNAGYSHIFSEHYLLPMAGALWSAPTNKVAKMPLHFLLNFLANHGLLSFTDHLQWQTIKGGSARYVDQLTAGFKEKIFLQTAISKVHRSAEKVLLTTAQNEQLAFDQVIFANHSDQALALLSDATSVEHEILGAITYQTNDVVLHYDRTLLPKEPRAIASWNYQRLAQSSTTATLTYYLNKLQNLTAPYDFCVTLNQTHAIDPDKILGRFTYEHPQYNLKTLQAQKLHKKVSGYNRTHFCGAYWGYGFHEDGVNSALVVCDYFGAKL